MKRTKIICTIGPATHTLEQLVALVEAGMNVCRLNFSHGTHEDHATLIELIRATRAKTGEPLTILQDLQGPKIRVGELPAEGIKLVVGKEVIFTTSTTSDKNKIPVTYPALHTDVRPGQTMLLDDGLLAVQVIDVKDQDVRCKIITGGLLTSHKGLNLPETKTSISAISEKDREDLYFGIEQNVDWVALSFVRSAQDIQELRHLITTYEQEHHLKPEAPIRIMAKIEKPEAVENLAEIIDAADGIMVARGDLGIEVAPEKVPVIQKRMIQACLKVAKPVVVATQMLDSMIRNPRATRAEISDIANAIIDRTDATMLSGETANGAYPVEAVRVMSATIQEVEKTDLDDLPAFIREGQTTEAAMTNIASVLAHASRATAILVASLSGNTAHLVSRYRPELPIYVATPNERVLHQLNVTWGVRPFLIPSCKDMPGLIDQSIKILTKKQALKAGDEVIIVAGEPLGESGHVNFVELRTVSVKD